MRRSVVVMAVVLLVSACGTLQGPRTGTISPPTDVLARWANFPSDQVPRPIVLFDYVFQSGQGFDSNDAKIAALCGKFALSTTLPAATPAQAVASWADGTRVTYPAISAAEALSALPRSTSGSNCSSVASLQITAARYGVAGFQTDRGTAQISAWLFTAIGARAEFAQPAVPTSAIWGGGASIGSVTSSARESEDGRVLTVNFVGGPAEGACAVDYSAVVAESPHAVAVAIQSNPGRTQAGPITCDLVGHLRKVPVTLSRPLGGRVLVDAAGGVMGVCPELAGTRC